MIKLLAAGVVLGLAACAGRAQPHEDCWSGGNDLEALKAFSDGFDPGTERDCGTIQASDGPRLVCAVRGPGLAFHLADRSVFEGETRIGRVERTLVVTMCAVD